ncbi:hypothetical protein A7X67_18605 [Clostridium sp. W14A]|jgi:hypothetical protein|nr:hypothetical protein A7X67_18605 [Clostridium sp. W14A]
MDKKIKIYVACHKEFYVPKHDFLYPIQVGTSLNIKEFPNMLHDNLKDNISGENPYYCELTAQYWAWKNDEADYYGFFHYRRYLSFQNVSKDIKCLPYKIYGVPSEKVLHQLCLEPKHMYKVICNTDVIAPIGEDMHVSVREHYSQSRNHFVGDLDLICEIVKKRWPQFSRSADLYLQGSINYFGNIFIMKKQLFYFYCEWLFDILSVYDSQNNIATQRVDGYLGERLFGIFYTWLKEQNKYRCLELPRAHFANIDGSNQLSLIRANLLNFILPPGSKRRSLIKKSLLR